MNTPYMHGFNPKIPKFLADLKPSHEFFACDRPTVTYVKTENKNRKGVGLL